MKQALIACLLMALVGCQTIGPKAAGRATGTAVYLGYAKIAEQKDDAFRAKVNALWTEVNKLETVDDLVNQVDRLSGAFDEIISGRNITPEEKAMLISLRNMVLVEVKKVIANRFQTNQEAVEFLVAFRDSVNNTIIAMTLLK